MDKAVVWRREDNFAIMTLNRPAEYNVINTEMGRNFRKALLEGMKDPVPEAYRQQVRRCALCA